LIVFSFYLHSLHLAKTNIRALPPVSLRPFNIADFLMNMKLKTEIYILGCFLLLSTHSAGCLNLADGCGNEILRVHYSPTKQLKAVIFERDCGATTGFSTQISIMAANGDLPNEGGNVFVADTDHGKSPSGPGGGPPVEVEWKGESSLNIIYDNRARVFLRKDSQNGVTISYSERAF
jgi:predicted small secreted protein